MRAGRVLHTVTAMPACVLQEDAHVCCIHATLPMYDNSLMGSALLIMQPNFCFTAQVPV